MLRHILLIKLLLLIAFKALCQDFFDDFEGNTLKRSLWKKADRKWGGSSCSNGGVIPENIFVKDGNLVIRANGDLYSGKINGHGQKTRVGGAVTTKRKFASGSFEVRAKICPQKGVLSAFWTYHHQNDTLNHEIDFEFPGKNPGSGDAKTYDLDWGIMTNWRGTGEKNHHSTNKHFGNQTDGRYHLYRFDWHTGTGNAKPRIEWYFDNDLIYTSYQAIPDMASRFWLGLWFPCWIGEAGFESDFMYIDWVRIRSFHEPGDVLNTRIN